MVPHKLSVEVKDKTATIRGKVWERGTPEPAKWTVEFEDPSPNREGAAALYGYISNILNDTTPGSEIYYDNVAITPHGGKPGEGSKGGVVAPPAEKK